MIGHSPCWGAELKSNFETAIRLDIFALQVSDGREEFPESGVVRGQLALLVEQTLGESEISLINCDLRAKHRRLRMNRFVASQNVEGFKRILLATPFKSDNGRCEKDIRVIRKFNR
jgi:hypothetical protein